MRGDLVTNPARMLSVDAALNAVEWTSNGAVSVNNNLSYALRKSMIDPSMLWVPSSEPASLPFANGAPRAMLLSADGSSLLGGLSVGPSGFDLASNGVAGRPTGRSGFAAAYSRTQNAIYVAGGVSGWGFTMTDVETFQGGRWTGVALSDPKQAPRNVQAAVYSIRDQQLWLVDDLGSGNLVLRRIDPQTGAIISYSGLAVLSGLSQVHLTTLNDGRVLIAGTSATGYRIAVVEATWYFAFFSVVSTIATKGQLDSAGELLTPPVVAGNSITFGRAGYSASGREVVLQPQTLSLDALGIR
jgi:hypothetical protein